MDGIDESRCVKSDVWDGRLRRLYPALCLFCGSEFLIPKKEILRDRGKFCSRTCRDSSRAKRYVEVECAHCHKNVEKLPYKLNSKHNLYFCDRKCKEAAQSLDGGLKEIQPSHYGTGNGAYDYRARALDVYGPVCVRCGYKDKKKMLDVDHKDSDHSNNDISNLQVLCVWCHAEKTRADWPD